MRLIDAEVFRRELDNHWPFTKEEQNKHGFADMAKSTVLFVLNKMPTIEERKWTPCSERLPVLREEVIATDGNYVWCANRVWYPDDKIIWEDLTAGWSIDGVIAWMPLPEPYKEEGEKNG